MEAPRHSWAYRRRRGLNWFPLGLAYAFFYMGRYNLTVARDALGELMSNQDFGDIFAAGAVAYGCSFLLTGPLTDRIGGRRAMLIGTAGTILMNTFMGLALLGISQWGWDLSIRWTFMALYMLNMHFQSYGAIAIVTVKAPWFHVRERGTFSTLFGWMIAAGIYFAFDWGDALVSATRGTIEDPDALPTMSHVFQWILGVGNSGVDENWWIFFTPAIMLGACWIAMLLWLRDSPGAAGYPDFDTGEASVSADGETLPIRTVFWKILTHPVLLVVCGIEFCSGVLRNAVMHWYYIFAGQTGIRDDFLITRNWGLSIFIVGVIGAALTGMASDLCFRSRRAPMAAILYGVMTACTVVMLLTLDASWWWVGLACLTSQMAVIGVHGIMSGTSTADFGGVRNAGAAVGIVDGMVYLGTAVQSFVLGRITPTGAAAADPSSWQWWPVFMLPFAVVGCVLSIRIWNALPGKQRS
jgi:OPA family glycerol-3-phosphate transporter-like MFS transporter